MLDWKCIDKIEEFTRGVKTFLEKGVLATLLAVSWSRSHVEGVRPSWIAWCDVGVDSFLHSELEQDFCSGRKIELQGHYIGPNWTSWAANKNNGVRICWQ